MYFFFTKIDFFETNTTNVFNNKTLCTVLLTFLSESITFVKIFSYFLPKKSKPLSVFYCYANRAKKVFGFFGTKAKKVLESYPQK
eukprot:UN10339